MGLAGTCLIILVIWNAIVFLLYAIDKNRAIKKKWRISERALLFCACLGGGAGGLLGMLLLHHKTRHTKFQLLLPLFALLTAALAVYLAVNV